MTRATRRKEATGIRVYPAWIKASESDSAVERLPIEAKKN